MWNRHGQPLTVASEFTSALEHLCSLPFEWLDYEALDGRHDIGRETSRDRKL